MPSNGDGDRSLLLAAFIVTSSYCRSTHPIRLESTSRALKRCGETRYSGRPFLGSSIEQPRNSRSKLIALLEVTEGLIQYVYQFWLADEIKGRTVQIQTWNSIMPLVNVVRRMWKDSASTDRQRAFLGLMCVSQQFILNPAGSMLLLTHFHRP